MMRSASNIPAPADIAVDAMQASHNADLTGRAVIGRNRQERHYCEILDTDPQLSALQRRLGKKFMDRAGRAKAH
jgi:hypothetical protein